MRERKRCCCNCNHDIRTEGKDGIIVCNCDVDNHYIGYVECFEGWCKRWASDKDKWAGLINLSQKEGE